MKGPDAVLTMLKFLERKLSGKFMNSYILWKQFSFLWFVLREKDKADQIEQTIINIFSRLKGGVGSCN